MLIEFKFKNFRSFRDETILSMEPLDEKDTTDGLISVLNKKLLPVAAIYGRNGGGKTNVVRAFGVAIHFICTAQRTQHENASIPVSPFLLDDFSRDEPTSFAFIYVNQGIKYEYGFSATQNAIQEEYLFHYPNGVKATVFSRKKQIFEFPGKKDMTLKKLISDAVAPNQLFFAVACTMNYKPCTVAMQWFRESVFVFNDFPDVPQQLIENRDNETALRSIMSYAMHADVGIEDMEFEFKNKSIPLDGELPDELPEDVKLSIAQFMQNLSDPSEAAEIKLQLGELTAISYHKGITREGKSVNFPLDLSDESDGTRRLMSLAPTVEKVLSSGGVFVVDELERELHPILLDYLIAKFNSVKANTKDAQLVFTTHNTELLNLHQFRKDQLYFVDKSRETGASELYSIADPDNSDVNVRKSYLAGKYGAIPLLEED